jgi:hypothetical protein
MWTMEHYAMLPFHVGVLAILWIISSSVKKEGGWIPHPRTVLVFDVVGTSYTSVGNEHNNLLSSCHCHSQLTGSWAHLAINAHAICKAPLCKNRQKLQHFFSCLYSFVCFHRVLLTQCQIDAVAMYLSGLGSLKCT